MGIGNIAHSDRALCAALVAVVIAPIAVIPAGLDLRRPYLTGVEVHRAGESIASVPSVSPAKYIDDTDNPVVAARIVVNSGVHEFHSASTETVALSSLPANGVLAYVDSLLCGEAAARTVAPWIAVATAWIAIASAATRAKAASGRGASIITAPGKVKGIALGTALRVLDANHGDAALSRVTNQILPATAVHSGKTETCRIARQGSVALEAAPLSRAA